MFWTKKAWWKSLLEVTKRERAGLLSLCVLLVILGWVTQRYRRYERKEAVEWSVHQIPNAAAPTKIGVGTESEKGWNSLPARNRYRRYPQRNGGQPSRWNRSYDQKQDYPRATEWGPAPPHRYSPQEERPTHARIRSAPRSIEVNQADSLDWLQLPGIGPLYTRRILRFRAKLGGFYTLKQVRETYGLPDTTYQQIETYLELRAPPKPWLNLNTADKETLSAHPYISQALARHIIAYRQQHGGFRKPEELRQVSLVSDSVWEKLSPYIIIN